MSTCKPQNHDIVWLPVMIVELSSLHQLFHLPLWMEEATRNKLSQQPVIKRTLTKVWVVVAEMGGADSLVGVTSVFADGS